MWYFSWILGILLACSISIIAALTFENSETTSHVMEDYTQKNTEK